MAKSPSFFGLRRGSTKTLTFSVDKGQQITKDRVQGGRNPRTPEQMAQRMCMATASAAYAQMKQIVDHSFEGVVYGSQTMAEFIRVNAALIRDNYLNQGEDFSYNPYRHRFVYFGKYQMSRGTAKPVTPKDSSYLIQQGDEQILAAFQAPGLTTGFTPKQFIDAYGLKVGDMATMLFLYEGDANGDALFGFVRLRVNASGTDELTAANFNDYFTVESNLPITTPSIVNGGFSVVVTAADMVDGGGIARCIVHSLKAASGWLRSTEFMSFNSSVVIRPDAQDALDTYPLGQSYVLNGGSV